MDRLLFEGGLLKRLTRQEAWPVDFSICSQGTAVSFGTRSSPPPIAVGILEQLFRTPVISVGPLARLFDISFPTASTVVSQLESLGILWEMTGRKRDKRYVYSDYLDIFAEETSSQD
jgi:hypothetical protein